VKALVVRLGATGDMIIISPVIKKLKEMGYYVILNTGKRGKEVFLNNPNVDEFLMHNEDMKIDDLTSHWEKQKEEIKPDFYVNFTESLEGNVALHPTYPNYIYPKSERIAIGNKNYYDVTAAWSKVGECQKLPELYFTEEEIRQAKTHLKEGKYNILWQMSGSGAQKVYPWADYVMGEILKNDDDVHIITTGDEKCQLLESLIDKDITNLSGKNSIRITMCLTKYVDLVVAPDTGILHASGCYSTPKIGLLGHTTIENITKYFKNDHSLEADCPCAPCMRLIYDHTIQCPVEFMTHAAWCMAEGIKPERLYARYREVRSLNKT
jgi:ADP-heptose:LPS heptosyltransferase